ALVLMPLVPLCGGTSPSFKMNLAIVTHASLVAVIGLALRALLILVRGPLASDIGFSLFLPHVKSGFAHALLMRIDPFGIWNTILVALGLKVTYDLKGSRIYYLIFGLWLAFLIVISLLAGAGPGAGT
ncbi:MAG: hypothetical protein ABIK62_06215, partial [candidate division WOR-3 bacterium]